MAGILAALIAIVAIAMAFIGLMGSAATDNPDVGGVSLWILFLGTLASLFTLVFFR